MILYRRGFGLFDQQELAKYFKIKVGKKQLVCFNIKLDTYTRTNYNEGLKTIESENIINRFFKSRKIPLIAKAVPASKIRNLESFLVNNLKGNNDLWVEYKSHRIHKKPYIHDNVVESLQKTRRHFKITLVDPAPLHKPRFVIGIKELQEAISDKYGRETGFVVISSKRKCA
jgi:hypothetical protein